MATAIRLKFSRKGPVSYLGHLDVLRYFQKAILRAGIDIRYSEGFNPHQILSFAYPLGVSMETYGDYCDIEVNSFTSVDDIVDSLNNVMNEGISIISASIVPDDKLNAMASVAMAEYKVLINDINLMTQNKIDDYMNLEVIDIEKEDKKGNLKLVNIREGVLSLTLEGEYLWMKLLSGSSLNIKPIQVIETFNKYEGTELNIKKIIRIDIYREDNEGAYIPLGQF